MVFKLEFGSEMIFLNKDILLSNIDKIHTTGMGIDRIKKNLKLNTNDVVEFCKNKILDKNCNIYKQGKNWYCEIDNIKITIKRKWNIFQDNHQYTNKLEFENHIFISGY